MCDSNNIFDAYIDSVGKYGSGSHFFNGGASILHDDFDFETLSGNDSSSDEEESISTKKINKVKKGKGEAEVSTSDNKQEVPSTESSPTTNNQEVPSTESSSNTEVKETLSIESSPTIDNQEVSNDASIPENENVLTNIKMDLNIVQQPKKDTDVYVDLSTLNNNGHENNKKEETIEKEKKEDKPDSDSGSDSDSDKKSKSKSDSPKKVHGSSDQRYTLRTNDIMNILEKLDV